MSKSPGLGLGRSSGFGLPGFRRILHSCFGMQEWVNTTAAEVARGVCIFSMQEEIKVKVERPALVSRVKTR